MKDNNKLLYEKAKVEYDEFIKKLKQMTPEKIINKAYETVIKSDILLEIYYPIFSHEEAKALYLEKYPLELMYVDWLAAEDDHMENLRYSIEHTAIKQLQRCKTLEHTK